MILALADRWHQMPHVIETQVDEYWLNQAATLMEAESIDRKRQDDEMKRKARK